MMTRRYRFTTSAIHLILLVIFLTGCTGVMAAPASTRPLRIAWSPWPGRYPMAVAAEQGLFANQETPVNVEPVLYERSEQALPDFEAGKLDGALVSLGEAMLLSSRMPGGVSLVLVTDHSAGADGIVASADISSVADLRGQRIGVSMGTVGEMFVRAMLQANNIPANEVTLVNMSPEEIPEAIPQVVQAGHTWEPFTSVALAKGYRVIFSTTSTPGLIPGVLVFQRAVVKERPEDVGAFINAWFEAVNYWQTQPENAQALTARVLNLNPMKISVDGVKLFTREDNRNAFRSSPDPVSLYTGGQMSNNFLISIGVLSRAPELNNLLDPSFLQ